MAALGTLTDCGARGIKAWINQNHNLQKNLGMPNRLETHLGELHAGLSGLARDLGLRDIFGLSTFSGLASLLSRRSRSRGFLLVLVVIARVVSLLALRTTGDKDSGRSEE
jgi:hypothetical protein